MSSFSRNTFDKLKHYVGVRLQQGVPLIDADWNEQEDIRKYELRAFLKWFVGNGVPKGNDGFCIEAIPAENDFLIKGGDGTPDGAGRCLIEGWDVINESKLKYTAQPLFNNPALAAKWGVDPVQRLTTPTTATPTPAFYRTDTVYLDVWEREVDAEEDYEHLVNPKIGIETCVRLKREWAVRVKEGANEPPTSTADHVFYPLAYLRRKLGVAAIDDIKDLRRSGLAVLSKELTIKDGKVGIGTTDPQYGKLMITTAAVPLSFREIGVNVDQGGLWRMPLDGGKLRFDVNTAPSEGRPFIDGYLTPLTMNKDGKVGIGSTSPKNKLDVAGGIVIGTEYAGSVSAPSNGLLVQGQGCFASNIKIGNSLVLSNEGSLGVQNIMIGINYLKSIHIEGNPYLSLYQLTLSGPDILGDLRLDHLYANSSNLTGSDYAEYFESFNGKKLPVGTSVVLVEGKIRPAKKNETPLGVISANPGVAGGVHLEWPKKYLRDVFGKIIMEEVMIPKKKKLKRERQKVEKKSYTEQVIRKEIVFEKGKYIQKKISEKITREVEEPLFKEVDLYDETGKKVIGKHKIPITETYEEEIEVLDDKGLPVLVGSGEFEIKKRPKLNPNYDESRKYIPRDQRSEWNCVGLLGQIPLRKDQSVGESWIKVKDISDDVELWLVK